MKNIFDDVNCMSNNDPKPDPTPEPTDGDSFTGGEEGPMPQ
jgi:hypothetical protein